MEDEKESMWAADKRRIALDDPQEIRRWAEELRCTEAEVRDAISKVGSSASAVRLYLRFR